MADRPYTLLSCCISLDGFLDDASEHRLVLSGEADLDRVDALRAACDAILVGAATVRADNPRLLVRDPTRVADRRAAGRPAHPTKVTVTGLAKLDPTAAFFTAGGADRIVYCSSDSVADARASLGHVADVVDGGQPVEMRRLSEDLHARGVRRLLVEGGGTVLSQFLAEDLADELQLAVAPLFVGQSGARRFVDDRAYPWTSCHRARLVETRMLDDVSVMRYALSPRFTSDLGVA